MRETVCHGIDLVEIDRLRAIVEGNPAFEAGVFTEEEIAYCRGHADPWPHFAARFAAKEAVLKALKRGLSTEGPDAALLDIEVVRGEGAPRLRLYGTIARMSTTLGMGEPVLSLTHAGGLAMASVVWPLRPEETT
jgi:holo-[acyl-carrier protein] synthase